ncbi:MAG: hypothetical protein A2762_01990 [Candidatus Lloydbacteria bacterium RIFCSPHIGHO2_01_FULL_54_11]|nr:MAG: hypothetical protein A2762_01990 [Candidatus Lloydbacteria bacterium RIFCSPHIGHO2_01_FULL_54_11]
MEQLGLMGRISGVLHKNINPIPILVAIALLCLFIFPGLLVVLVPIIFVVYRNKLQTQDTGFFSNQHKPTKRKDPRRFWVTILVLVVALLGIYLASGLDVGVAMLIVVSGGICTGGFIWAPLVVNLVARLILFRYDRATGNTTYRDTILPGVITAFPVGASNAASVPVVPMAPPPAPDLSALSPADQSLVMYIADASARGVMGGEISLILKGNGWLDADVARGFELVRTYYSGVLKSY